MYFYVQLLSVSSEGCLLVYSFELLLIQHFAAGVTVKVNAWSAVFHQGETLDSYAQSHLHILT